MKRKIVFSIILVLSAFFSVLLCSCSECKHDYSSTVTENASCDKEGTVTYTCSLCGDSFCEKIPKLEHSLQSLVTIEATCTNEGAVTYTCSSCGYSYSEEIPKIEHSYKSLTTAPTCTEKGYTTRTCTCGYSYVDNKYIDALGHKEEAHEGKAATCTEIGWEPYVTCARCDYTTYCEVPTSVGVHSAENGICTLCGLAESTPGLEFALNLDGKSYTVTGIANQDINEIVITFYNNMNVTAVGDMAFYNNDALISVTLGESIAAIGDNAFRDCSRLVEVINHSPLSVSANSTDNGYIGDYALEVHNGSSKIVYIDDYAFYPTENANYLVAYVGDSKDLRLPESFKGNDYEINKSAFVESEITSVVIEGRVIAIGHSAFFECEKLISVTLGESIKEISVRAFEGCKAIFEIVNNSPLEISLGERDHGDIARYAQIIGSGSSKIVNIGKYRFYSGDDISYLIDYFGTDTELVLPEDCEGKSYEIFDETFSYLEGLTSVIIPNGVTVIGGNAFKRCPNLKSITIGNGLRSIEFRAFYNCINLKNIYISDLAAWCAINFESSDSNPLSNGGNLYVNGNLLTELTVPNGVTEIGAYAFCEYTKLTAVSIPEGVTSIGAHAFQDCAKLKSVSISEGVTSIGSFAFSGCTELGGVVFPSTLVSIGNDAFKSCHKIYTLELPEGFKTIGESAFAGSSLLTVKLPATLESIGKMAFSNCYGIETVYISDLAKWCTVSFGYNATPFSTANELYIDGVKTTEIIIPDGVTQISAYAFSECGIITSVIIPDSVITIGAGAFEECGGLLSVTIGNGVTSIGSSAFYNCKSLKSLVMGNSIREIDNMAFHGCKMLKGIYLPKTIETIGKTVFIDYKLIVPIYYQGTASEWANVDIDASNKNIVEERTYFYSADKPTEEGNYWHYDENGQITVWQ